jgi:hypothetical protein
VGGTKEWLGFCGPALEVIACEVDADSVHRMCRAGQRMPTFAAPYVQESQSCA